MLRTLIFIGLAACTCAPPEPPKAAADRSNVLLIVWDTTRADRLSAYGYERPTTPWLDRFAAESAVFEHAVSPAIWTLPGHASIFTGEPVRTHGAISTYKWLDHRFETVAEWLGGAGYNTWAFSANPYLGEHTNLTQGFEQVEHPWDNQWKRAARAHTHSKLLDGDRSNTLGPAYTGGKFPSGRKNDNFKDAGPVAAQAFSAFLDRTEGPFFATINLMEAHVPRIPSMESREAMFSAEEIAQQLELTSSFGYLLAFTTGNWEYTPEELERIGQVYDASLRDLDLTTQGVMQELERRGQLDNTIVILTSDHGEQLGEHHMIGHKFSVYNPLVRVPLVVRYPSKVSPERVAASVSTADVFATLGELLDRPIPESTPGTSLFSPNRGGPQVSELAAATPRALQRMSEQVPDFDWTPYLRTWRSIDNGARKCIRGSDASVQVYDVQADPLEASPLGSDDALCAELDAWVTATPPYDPSLATPEDTPKSTSPDLRKRLEALGYMEAEK